MKLKRVSTNSEATVNKNDFGFLSKPTKGIWNKKIQVIQRIRQIKKLWKSLESIWIQYYQIAADEYREKARDETDRYIGIFTATRASSNWNENSSDGMIEMRCP